MNTIRLKQVAVLTAVLLLLPSPALSQQQGKVDRSPDRQPLVSQTCTNWNLAADFLRSPEQENPNRDSCGNLDVWHFMSTDADRQEYTLLARFTTRLSGVPGLQSWMGIYPENPEAFLPHVAVNETGSDYGLWLPDTINIHPSPGEMGVVGWRSPISGAVAISGAGTDVSPICGSGVGWAIDLNTTNLASGIVPNGGRQDFRDGAGGDLLAYVPVQQGDMVYLAIDPLGDYCGSGTLTEFSIHLLSSSPGNTVSGRVSDTRSIALPGAVVSLDGVPRVVTDSVGLYALTTYTGTHTITAASPCSALSPAERTVTVPPDAPGQDFTARSTCTFLPVLLWNGPFLTGPPALSQIGPNVIDTPAYHYAVRNNATGGDCLTLGGTWDTNTAMCSLSNRQLFPYDTLTIEEEATLRVLGIYNEGSIEVQAGGAMDTVGSLVNHGAVICEGFCRNRAGSSLMTFSTVEISGTLTTDPGATITNWGRIHNSGTLSTMGSVDSKEISSLINEGLWRHGGFLLTRGYTSRLINLPNGTLQVTLGGTIHNNGTLENSGRFDNEGSVTNASSGNVDNENIIDNSGSFDNYGSWTNHPGGVVANAGAIKNFPGSLPRHGRIINEGGATLTNSGTIDNDAMIHNQNCGTIRTSGAVNNQGTIRNDCYATFEGQITGNPIQHVCSMSFPAAYSSRR